MVVVSLGVFVCVCVWVFFFIENELFCCLQQEMQENVKKCKNFLATLIKLASHNSPSPETSKNVKALVQDLLVSFTKRCSCHIGKTK